MPNIAIRDRQVELSVVVWRRCRACRETYAADQLGYPLTRDEISAAERRLARTLPICQSCRERGR